MPTLEVYLPQGHADERKASLIQALTQATVDAISAPAESVRVLLSELPTANLGLGGKTTPAALPVIVAIKDIPNTDFGIGGQTARALGR
jgi:4-oxalocrotonate tautomerase